MRFFWLLICCSIASSLLAQGGYTYSNYQYTPVDTLDWRAGVPYEMGHFRVQLDVDIPKTVDTSERLALVLSLLAASEAYWDGKWLGKNGRVGENAASEIPGSARAQLLLPPKWLTPGTHRIELVISNWHVDGKARFYGVWVSPYLTPLIGSLRITAFLYAYAGCFFFIGLFFAFRFLTQRSRTDLAVFAFLSLSFAALVIVEWMRTYYFYPYPWHFTRLRIILALSQLIGLALPAFFALRFGWKKWWYLLPQLLIYFFLLRLARHTYDYATNLSVITGLCFATTVAVWAAVNKKTGSRLALIGIVPPTLALILFYGYYDYLLYVGFGHLVLMILLSLALRERELRRDREEALLRSTRLELELLKKNIQPHFLMNSLSSAVDWMEEDPSAGVELLLALGEESEILLASANKKLIPLKTEIELCRHHLRIMSFRKMREFEFTVNDWPTGRFLPPATLLTLIENGLSHQHSPHFNLRVFSDDQNDRYVFISNGKLRSSHGGEEEGTGLRYVQARLREAYGHQWTFRHGPVPNGWQTEIRVPSKLTIEFQ